jgi:hypothetical protein
MKTTMTKSLLTVCICTGLVAVLGARGGCYVDPCPDLYIACPDLECPDGFKVDKNGCAICECIGEPAPLKCMSDAECGADQFCSFDTCETPPGCEDGQDCIAVCYGLCQDRGVLPCASDVDCERGEVCIDGRCTAASEGCWSNQDCPAGLVCDIVNYCDAPPGCDEGMACPAVCYGRCVPPTHDECTSDRDCPAGFFCALYDCAGLDENGDGIVDCNGGGMCVPMCPEYAPPYCPNGELISQGYDDMGCPLPPICVTRCEGLDPEQCRMTDGCMLVELPTPCACECQDPSTDCDCACPLSLVCMPSEPQQCELLDEQQCLSRPDCQAVYGGWGCACPECVPGEECYPCDCPPPSDDMFLGCTTLQPQGCEGLDMDACRMHPECELIEVPMGRPCYCDCPADGSDCICDDCNDMGWMCVPRQDPTTCEQLDEGSCLNAQGCMPRYEEMTACPACMPGSECPPCQTQRVFVGCFPVEPPVICGDGSQVLCDMIPPVCERGLVLGVFNGCFACVPPEQCGPFPSCDTVRCMAGTHCELVQVECFAEPCYPVAMCVPDATACASDADCGEGFFCNTCPPDPNCPMCAVCGPAVCEPLPTQRCESDRDCPNGFCDICEECMGPQTVGMCVFPSCDDGSEALCDMIPPTCAVGETLAVRNNCYACVDARTCAEPTLTCANVRCMAGTHCEMVQVQCFTEPCPPLPECVPDETDPPVCADDTVCSDGSRCVNGRCGG